MIMAKGDDLYIHAKKIIQKHFDKNFKISRPIVPSFVGFIIYDKLYLDIPKLTVRVLNRNYADNKSISDYIIAVKDWLSVIKSQEHLTVCSILNAKRYGLSVAECEYLLGFLFAFSRGRIINTTNSKILVRERKQPFVLNE
ncbi:hypothetical protein [Beihai sea slater virus 4]|uniref:hypothetical protein n=1 Tax=Beihai sea slater virus 4 TaxID=1922660 RepID=UPI00090C5762|nr:hypothetical protein [Beihai sea slater virus 4]APG77553.1 hypothetical protein [Beihai sea slater virus 4]